MLFRSVGEHRPRFLGDEKDVEARAMLAYSLFVGAYFVRAEHGKRTRAEVMRLAVDRLLDERWV